IDYGNPIWIERCMMTGKLIRDLWTDYDMAGYRHFRANFFGAAQVGGGDQTNHSWINYRAVSAATSVLEYNHNPAIAKLYTELAEAWLAAAMSTERGKPRGVIPAEVSFPDGIIGGVNSPNWYTASHPPGTVNHDFRHQAYKGYILSLLMSAYKETRDPKFLEPMRLEYELAMKHGNRPDTSPGRARRRPPPAAEEAGEPGSEEWTAKHIRGHERWLEAQRLMQGRTGDLRNVRTKAEVVEQGRFAYEHMKKNWPLCTSEAGPTDRVGFPGIVNPFFIYTGGAFGGPLLKAAVTYENTTKDFAAAVLAADSQGLRILYYSLAPDAREIAIVPWELEVGGKYRLQYGIDRNDDEKVDTVVEEREFVLPQVGWPIRIKVEPRTNYVIEIDQLERGRGRELMPDPAITSDDIRYVTERNLLLARVHNVGSKPVRDVIVAFYDGDPDAGGALIGTARIPNLEAPLDLEPRTVTVGINYDIGDDPRDIYVALDPDGDVDEITTFNNRASASLPRPEEDDEAKPTPRPAEASFKRGR
ncbi:MAG: hypothetical protein ACE5JM_05820, partial [Armatimonadota bacterium]